MSRKTGGTSFAPVGEVQACSETLVLKQIRLTGLTHEEQEETTKEAHIMLSLDEHENVVKHHVSFIEAGALNIVMEYCSGGDLGKLIRETKNAGGRFSEKFIWQVFIDACSALHHLHKNRVLHRDIKPENVFLDSDSRAKLGDLGLGRLLGPNSKHAQSTVGTPLYFSPELCREELYDERSDVWALGCLVYQMAVLEPPFVAQNPIALAQKIVCSDFKPLPKHYSSDLTFLVSRMLEKDARRRPNTAQLLQYGPVKIYLIQDRMRRREQELKSRFNQREIELNRKISDLEKRLHASQDEVRQMRQSHDEHVARLCKKQTESDRRAKELEARIGKAHGKLSQRRPCIKEACDNLCVAALACLDISGEPGHARTPLQARVHYPSSYSPAGRAAQPPGSRGNRASPVSSATLKKKGNAPSQGKSKPSPGKERTFAAGSGAKGAKFVRTAKARLQDKENLNDDVSLLPKRNLFPATPVPSQSPLKTLGPARRVPTNFVVTDEDDSLYLV